MFFNNDKNQKYAAHCLQRQFDILKTTEIVFGMKLHKSLSNIEIEGQTID